MKRFLALILAAAVLAAMCACAEKIRELTPKEAAELLNSDLKITAFLDGGHNISGAELITENGIEYAQADDASLLGWDSFISRLNDTYTKEAADKILASGDCLEKDGMTYIRYLGPAESGNYSFSVTSFGNVTIDPESDSQNATAVHELEYGPDDKESLSVSYENTSDGWRIAGIN